MAAIGPRRFRFGVRHTGSTLEEGQRVARKAEDLGFSTFVVQDHADKQLAPLLALMSAAAVTSTLRLGTVVLNNNFRHPAILAKEAATVDVLTNGRLELGLGAGVNVSHVEVTTQQQVALAQLAARLQIAPQDVLQAPTALVGSVDAIVEQLHDWLDQYNVPYFIVPSRLMDSLAPVIARVVGT